MKIKHFLNTLLISTLLPATTFAAEPESDNPSVRNYLRRRTHPQAPTINLRGGDVENYVFKIGFDGLIGRLNRMRDATPERIKIAINEFQTINKPTYEQLTSHFAKYIRGVREGIENPLTCEEASRNFPHWIQTMAEYIENDFYVVNEAILRAGLPKSVRPDTPLSIERSPLVVPQKPTSATLESIDETAPMPPWLAEVLSPSVEERPALSLVTKEATGADVIEFFKSLKSLKTTSPSTVGQAFSQFQLTHPIDKIDLYELLQSYAQGRLGELSPEEGEALAKWKPFGEQYIEHDFDHTEMYRNFVAMSHVREDSTGESKPEPAAPATVPESSIVPPPLTLEGVHPEASAGGSSSRRAQVHLREEIFSQLVRELEALKHPTAISVPIVMKRFQTDHNPSHAVMMLYLTRFKERYSSAGVSARPLPSWFSKAMKYMETEFHTLRDELNTAGLTEFKSFRTDGKGRVFRGEIDTSGMTSPSARTRSAPPKAPSASAGVAGSATAAAEAPDLKAIREELSLMPLKPDAYHRIVSLHPETKRVFPRDLLTAFEQFIMNQSKALKVVSRVVHSHYAKVHENNKLLKAAATSDSERILRGHGIAKTNLVVVGPTGSGKTATISLLKQLLDVPVIIVDGSSVTPAGWVGDDISGWIKRLFEESGYNPEKTSRGIICIDEFDKILGSTSSHDPRGYHGTNVQSELLKVVEGGVYNIKINPTQSVALDTSGILWIAMGVFDGIKKDSDGRINHAALVEHGMTPEMAGRFPDICVYNATDQGMLKKILMESESSPIKQAIQFLGGDAYRVNLAFEDSAYDLIAEKALKHGNGARSLNSVVNHLLSHIINDAHDYYGKSVTLTGRKVSILLEDLPAYDPSEREAPPSHMYT